MKKSLNDLIEKEKIAEIIKIHDFKSNISEEIVDSSILLSTSITESFSMVLVEGMACGVPVISFDCPSGPREIINNNENGFLIKDFNETIYMDNLQKLMHDENLRKSFGRSAKNKSYDFRIEKIIYLWKEVFENEK